MKREEMLAYRAKLLKKIEALDVLLEEDEEASPQAPLGRIGVLNSGVSISLSQAVEAAVLSRDGDFTSKDVLAYVIAHFPSLSDTTIKDVGGPLTRLRERGKIEKVRDGAGNLPTIYRRPAAVAA